MEKQIVFVRNVIFGAGRPKIAVPLTAQNPEELEQALEMLAGVPMDLLEYRADHDDMVMLGGGELLRSLQLIRRSMGDKPVLFTVRTGPEGGEAWIPYAHYRRLLTEAAASGLVDLVDVELLTAMEHAEELISELHALGVRVIASSHDFEKTPSEKQLTAIARAMEAAGADIIKLAVMPETRKDVLRFMETARVIDEEITDRPCITMSMGRLGMISRLAGGLTGSCVTFGMAGKASAPGQVEAETLLHILETL